MKKSGSKTKSEISEHSKKDKDFQDYNLESLLNITNTSIWTLDKNYYLTFGNSIYYEECLNTFNKIIKIGETVLLDTLDEEDKIEWKNYYDRALDGERFSIERKRKYQQKPTWRVYHFGPVKNSKEEIIGASVVANDITERILAEQSLQRSTRRFEEFVNMLPEAIFEMDENFSIIYANQKAFDLFGYSESDFSKGLDAFSMLDMEDREKAKINFQNRLKGFNPGPLEYTALKKDGTKFPVLFHANSIYDGDKLKGIRGLMVDISERKHLEAKQQQMAIMLDLAPSSIIIHDFEGGIIYANKKAFELHQYSKEEFLSLSLKQIDSSILKEDIPERMKMIIENGKANFQVEHFRKDGTILPLEVFAVLTKWDNKDAVLSVGTDITERVSHEKELKESEEKFKTITENSPDAILLVDKKGNYVYANQATSDLLGYTVEELLKSNIKNIEGEDDYRKEIFQKVLKNKKYQRETMIKRKDGSLILVDINAIILPNGLLYASARDLTEQKEFEIELEKSYKMLNDLTSMVPGVVYQYRLYPDGHFSFPYSSPGMYEIFEVTSEEVKEDASLVFTRIHPDDIEYLGETINESAQRLKLYHSEFRVILPKQGLRWRLCDAKPQRLEDGSTLWYGIITDITERKKVEEKLRAHETFLKDTQKIAKLGTYKMDITSGNWESSEILDEIFGINEIFTKNVEGWVSIIHPDWKEIMNDYLINEVIGNKVKFNKEYQITRQNDKEQRWVHGLGRLEYDKFGNPAKMIGTIQDITEVKNIQKELIKAKEKAEESDRLKSAFLANMSHEIRTPMNGILGFANLLKEPQLNGDEQKMYIDIIEKSGERMLNTINNIIDISKIEAGQIEIIRQEFSISKKLNNILRFFKPEADKKGIQLILKNELTQAEDKITSDEEKLNAIFTNLVKNAIKFCDEGKIEISCKRKGKYLEFYVKDSGKGIPSDRQQAIFDRFVQANIEDRNAHQGSGLGLAITKSYVELLAGKIWVESEKEKGSTFYFTIPYYPAIIKITQSEKGNDNDNKIEKLNILIVEDDNVSEILIKTMIEGFSKNIYTAKTGLEAIEICKTNPGIDLILMDIKMPLMDGYEATQKIRDFNKNVTIIATTAFALAGDRERALDSGCNDYLPKPIMRDRLNAVIKQHFS